MTPEAVLKDSNLKGKQFVDSRRVVKISSVIKNF